jgi:O-antigen ligase
VIALLAIPAAALAARSIPWAVAVILALAPLYLLKSAALGVPFTALEAIILGAALGVFVRSLILGRPLRVWGRLGLPLVVLVAVWAASAALSHDPRAGFGAVKAWLVEPLIVALMALHAPRSEASRGIMLGGLMAGAVGLSLYGIAEKIVGLGLPPDGRLNSVFVPANYHAMLTAPILVMVLPFLRRPGGRLRWVLTAGAGVLVVALLLSESYGALIGVGAAALVWIATLSGRQRRVTLLVLAIVAVVAIGSQAGSEKFQRLGRLGERSSASVRVQIWHTSVELIRQHPVLGVGPNAFEAPYRQAVPKLFWPPLEWLVAQPHSLYFALLTETGVVGFAAFVWLLAVWWRTAVRPLRSLSERPWALAALLAVISILIHGFVDTPLFKNDLAVVFAFTLALPFLPSPETESRRA